MRNPLQFNTNKEIKMILVTNPYNMSVELRAFDGDTVLVNPHAKDVPVDDKFSWKLPSSGLYYDKAQLNVPSTDTADELKGKKAGAK